MLPEPLYATAALALARSGLGGVIPVPRGKKFPPLSGWTGGGAPYPDHAQICSWVRTHPNDNTALRLGLHVAGVDVDAYGDKEGGQSYAQLVAECGEAPTWMVTNHPETDGILPGIRLYTVPGGVTWSERRAGPGIDLIHHGHRYVVAPPSIHPSGRRYRWIAPDGVTSERPPTFDELTPMPASWGRRLSLQPHVAQARPVREVRSGTKYALATLQGVVDDLAAVLPGQGRNAALNRAAYSLGGLVGGGLLAEADARAALYDAAAANGHLAKHGERRTERTIDSGLRAGIARPRTGAAA